MQNRSKLGRPFSIRLYPESATLLDELAAEEDRSKNAIIRRALDFYAQARISASSEDAEGASPRQISTAASSKLNGHGFVPADNRIGTTRASEATHD